MNIDRSTLTARAARHAALADVARLAVVDELAVGDRSPSELQAALDLPSNLMAHHLKVLQDAGVVGRRRSEGDRRRTYLTLLDRSVTAEATSPPIAAERVVFVCSANSARSQLAAALWSAKSDVPVSSAGTRPADRIHDGARAAADRHGLRLVSDAPHHVDDVDLSNGFVVAVCDNAYEELGAAVSAHWSIPDPVAQATTTAFDEAHDELDRRITHLVPRLVAS